MINAERILDCLNSHLQSCVELTLYGRAALHRADIEQALAAAVIPDSSEIREQFEVASQRLLRSLQ